MKRKIFSSIICSFFFFGLLGQGVTAQKKSPAPSEKNDPNRIIAKVNGKPIYFNEVEKRIDNFEAKFKEINPKLKLPEERKQKMRKDFLDRLIREKILEEAADKYHITVTDKEIDERIDQLKKLFGQGEAAEKRFLSGIKDMQEFRRNIAKEVKAQKYFEMMMKDKKPTVSDEEIKTYYDTHPDQFKKAEAVKVRHILWRLPPKESEDYEKKLAETEKQAMEVMKLVTSGQDFGELAKKYSEDKTTASRGGEIGWISKGRKSKPFEDTAFSLAVGEVSKPVKTNFGIHLIQVTDKRKARVMKFDEVKDKIRSYLEKKKKAGLEKDIYEQLKRQAKIEIFL